METSTVPTHNVSKSNIGGNSLTYRNSWASCKFCFIHSTSWIIFVAYLFARQARVDDMNIHDNVAVKQTYAMLDERRSHAGEGWGVVGGDRQT